jgi:hypothetical protein
LDLLKLYGKRGRLVEDPRVMTMLEDQKTPPVNSDEAKRLLRLLHDLDDAWRNNRSGPVLNGITLPEPSGGTFDKSGPFTPEPKSNAGSPRSQMTTPAPRHYSHVPILPVRAEVWQVGLKKKGRLTLLDIRRGGKRYLWTNYHCIR